MSFPSVAVSIGTKHTVGNTQYTFNGVAWDVVGTVSGSAVEVLDGRVTATEAVANAAAPQATTYTKAEVDVKVQTDVPAGAVFTDTQLSISSTAEAQAGTDDTTAISPLKLREGLNAAGSAPIYANRAWVNFNGTGTVAIRASGNVSTIGDNGVGDYTLNFITAMPDADFTTIGMIGGTTGVYEIRGADGVFQTTTSSHIICVNDGSTGAAADVLYCNLTFNR